MTKKIVLFIAVLGMCSVSLFSIEAGIIGGNISNPSHRTYGLSAGAGLFLPFVKFEAEYFRISGIKAPEVAFNNGATLAIKVRPKISKFAPYLVAGIGGEFEKFNLKFSKYDKFSFVGGGIHLFVTDMVSFRGDVRFYHYTKDKPNRTRVSAGIFLHI